MSNSLEIRLIGELEVLRDGRKVALPASKKSRALLAYLVASNRPALRDRLCELLWDGPDDPRAALRWSLTKLRPAVDDRLVADRDRIEFQAAGADIDLLRVRELTARGVGAMTSDDLRAAASLIRGELLEGLDLASSFRYQQWCAGEREALRQLHVRILGRLVDVLPSGDEALAFARRRAAVDPFNEEAHIGLIRLLAAMERPQDALRHYDDCRAMFERELGYRPSNALEDARRAVGRSQPSRSAPAPAVVAQTDERTTLVGRARELQTIDDVLNSKTTAVVVISGEPGIGKSRLLAEVRHRAEKRGETALYGRAFAAEMVRPYGVWVDALRPLANVAAPELRADLAPLFPELGAAADVHDRARLFDGVSRLLTTTPRVVLALDDVQWFDESSVALLHYIARAASSTPLVIACAARSGELQDNAPALRVVRDLTRQPNGRHIELRPLSAAEARELAGTVSSDADADRIASECGGNPLFAIELARTPQSHRHTLLETIGERLTQRDARARDLVPWAAALGRHFDVDILGRTTGIPAGEMLSALEHLENASVLRGSDRFYDFTHDLIREAAYQMLSGPRRRIAHREIARALREMHDPDGAVAGEILHHAALAGENEIAASAAVTAGKRCLRLFAYVEAQSVADQGLQLAESLPPETRIDLQMRLLYVILLCRSSLPRSRRDFLPRVEALSEEARRHGLARVAGLGSHLLALIHAESEAFDDAASATLQAAEISRGVDPERELLAIAATARCLLLIQRDVPRAVELTNDAQALAARNGLENAELPAALGFLHAHRGEYDRAAFFLERSLELAARDQDHWHEWIAINRLTMAALEQGDIRTAVLHCQRMQPITAKMAGGSEGPRSAALLALAELLAGDRDDMNDALEQLRVIDSKGDVAYALNFVAQRHFERGELKEAEAAARESLTAAEVVGRRSEVALARAILAEIMFRRGDRKGARTMLEPALDPARWPDLTTRSQNEVMRCASLLKQKEKRHGNHGRRTVV